MCLLHVKEISLKKDEGYVVLKLNGKKLMAFHGPETYKVNKKYKAEYSTNWNTRAITNYKPGFHYFLTLLDAQAYGVKEPLKVIYKATFYNSYVEGLTFRESENSRVAQFRVLKKRII